MAELVCPPLWWWCVQGTIVVPCFCSQLFKSGSLAVAEGEGWGLVFCILLSIICPNCTRAQLFLVPCSFFLFFGSGGEVCPGASTAAKGPRSQLVSCPLKQKWKQNQGHSTLHVQWMKTWGIPEEVFDKKPWREFGDPQHGAGRENQGMRKPV